MLGDAGLSEAECIRTNVPCGPQSVNLPMSRSRCFCFSCRGRCIRIGQHTLTHVYWECMYIHTHTHTHTHKKVPRKCHAMNNTWCNRKYYIYDAIDIKDLWCKLECPSRNEVIIVRVDGRGNMRHLLTTVRVGQQPYQHATLADFYTLACWHVQGTNALLS